jgi:hypothetical protein
MDIKTLENKFSYHSPVDGQPTKYNSIRTQALVLAAHLIDLCPPSMELDQAVLKVEESVMWATAAIARHTLTK